MDAARLSLRDCLMMLVVAILVYGLLLRQGGAEVLAGHLPDTDDMLRLAQVRDWLAGQGFTDLAPHRLGAAGWAMHWSRLGDLGIAAWILTLRPFVGAAQADILATIAWPATLFLLYLAAAARLSMRIAGRATLVPALIIAALAFPAITMFVPGRIDHHGLQICLVLAIVEALVRPATLRAGGIAGLACAASLAIGLETAPQALVAMAALLILWLREGAGERARILGFGAALGGATALWLAIAKPDIWPTTMCDAFTPASVSATLAAAIVWIGLAAITPRLSTMTARLSAALGLGTTGLLLIGPTLNPCFSGPYGAVDPLLQRLWLAHVEEARGLFTHSIDVIIAFGGLAFAGTTACICLTLRSRARGWAILAGFQLASLAITLIQVRGAPIAAALAAPALAQLIVMARAHMGRPGAALRLVGAWLMGTGAVWNAAGAALIQPQGGEPAIGPGCTDPATMRRLAALAPGTVIAPMDAGAYILGSTPHRVLGAPYHRNNAGNRADYDFWLSAPDRAQAIAARWHADYVLSCPDSFGGIDLAKEGPGGMAIRITAGTIPAWLQPITPLNGKVRIFRVLPAPRADR